MKKFLNILGISLMIVVATMISNKAEAQRRGGLNISFQTFNDELSPYGEWIDYPEYGYTWRPRVGNDFRPYSTNGRWVYADDYDWMWASEYNWGWAPFHYGRWFYDDYYGWMWVPGYDWSPAWVSWRGGGDYYGWAPLQPGFSISLGFGGYNPPSMYWNFAHGRYMSYNNIGRYCSPWSNNITIINQTTIINNYSRRNNYYVSGPDRRAVERYTGRIKSVNVRETNNPGRGGSLRRNDYSMYRPSVDRSARGNDNSLASPRNVRAYDAGSARGNSSDRNNGRISSNRNNVDENRSTSRVSRNNRNSVENSGIDGQRNNAEQRGRSIENGRNATINRNAGVDRNQSVEAPKQRIESSSSNRAERRTRVEERNNNERPGNIMRQRNESPQVMEQPRTERRNPTVESRPSRVESAPAQRMESRPSRVESAPAQRSSSMGERGGAARSESRSSGSERRGRN